METVYSVDGKEEIDIKSDLFQMLTKARDEAHRFALSSSSGVTFWITLNSEIGLRLAALPPPPPPRSSLWEVLS